MVLCRHRCRHPNPQKPVPRPYSEDEPNPNPNPKRRVEPFPPPKVQAAQRRLAREMESHPDRWFRQTMPRLLKKAIQCAEGLINAPAGSVALVVNATEGVNAVMRSAGITRGPHPSPSPNPNANANADADPN